MPIPHADTSDELTDEELELVVGGMKKCQFQQYIVEILNTCRIPPDDSSTIASWGSGSLDPRYFR